MKLRPALIAWLPIGITVLVLGALIYITSQQNLRQNANDPQIQLAEDAAVRLGAGSTPGAVVGTDILDAGRSLAPFLIVFDDAGKSVASSGQLDGATPAPPAGSLDYARAHGQNRFTWQPTSGVRLAAVISYYHQSGRSGYILAARSLREVEVRENRLAQTTALALLLFLASSLALVAATKPRS